MNTEHFDVLVIGAGISGIDAAYHLQKKCPNKSFVVLEGRGSIGGTWDLFRYPGIRSDSDMYTFSYGFMPWKEKNAIANASEILRYLRATIDKYDLEKYIRYHHWTEKAEWSSEQKQWTISAYHKKSQQTIVFTCNFLFSCTGYYDYD